MPAKKTTKKATASSSKSKKGAAKKASKKSSKKSQANVLDSSASANVLIVNIIPRQMSFETNNDSEPNLDVSPTNPLHMAASAFTPDPTGGPNAPIFISRDGGNTWTINSIVPGGNNGTGTGDITLRFSRTPDKLYAAILRGDVRLRMNILRTDDFSSPATMTVLRSRDKMDQPYVQTMTKSSAGTAKDIVFVGDNDFNTTDGRTATLDFSNNAATG